MEEVDRHTLLLHHPEGLLLIILYDSVLAVFFFSFNYFWLCWVFIAARGLSLAAASGGYSLLRCAGFSWLWLILLRSMGSRRASFSSFSTRASVVAARGLSSCGTWA